MFEQNLACEWAKFFVNSGKFSNTLGQVKFALFQTGLGNFALAHILERELVRALSFFDQEFRLLSKAITEIAYVSQMASTAIGLVLRE